MANLISTRICIQFILILSLLGLSLPLPLEVVSPSPINDSASHSDPIPSLLQSPITTVASVNSSTTSTTSSNSNYNYKPYGKGLLAAVLKNVKRQIGNSSPNPISNLHEKVNGQGERGGQGLNVTDVSSSLEFTTTRTTFTETKSKEHQQLNQNQHQQKNHFSPLENVNSNSSITPITLTRNSNISKISSSSSRNETFATTPRADLGVLPGQISIPTSTSFLPPPKTFFSSSKSSKGGGDSLGPAGDIYGSLIRRYKSVNDVHNSPKAKVDDDGDGNGIFPFRSAGGTWTDLSREKERTVSCPPVIVNQTFSLNYTDVDKWARALVKITQCVANCLGSSYNSKYNMSPKKKGMNGVGLGSNLNTKTNWKSKWDSSQGISSSFLPNNNEDIRILKNNLNDKLLSSCQKSCKLPPRKSSTTPITEEGKIRGNKENVTEETNKENEWNKKNLPSTPRARPTEIKAIGKPIAVKADDFSSSTTTGHGLVITRSDTGVFHLHWPKITSPKIPKTTSILMPMLYTVILEKSDADCDGEGRWKLIDQTVAQQTQISLVADVCQQNLQIKFPKPTLTIHVFAVSSKGFHKLFSASLLCCQEELQRAHHKIENLGENYDKQVSTSQVISNKHNLNKPDNKIIHPDSSNSSKPENNGMNINVKVKSKPEILKAPLGNDIIIEKGTKESSSLPQEEFSSWGLRTISMVYQNFLVVTEVSWDFPLGPSNQRNVSSSPSNSNLNNSSKSSDEKYLLTWEIFGGGLRGNLVTDMTSGTISLWPDTAYFIQVGLINNESPNLSLSSSITNPDGVNGKSVEGGGDDDGDTNTNLVEEQHQNYMSNLLGLESIVLPLAEGEPKVTVKSARLLVNTSQVSMPTSSKLSSSSQSNSQRSLPSTDSIKSNNPQLQEKVGDTNEHEKSLQEEEKEEEALPPLESFGRWSSLDVSSIIIQTNDSSTTTASFTTNTSTTTSSTSTKSTDTVSKNGNENDHLKLKDSEVDHSRHRHNQYEYYHHENNQDHNGYMGDSPRNDGEKDEKPKAIHSYHNTLDQKRKNFTQSSSSSFGGRNGSPDKTSNINDNKSNNNFKSKSKPDHERTQEKINSIFRGDVYQGLFALNIDNGGGGGGTFEDSAFGSLDNNGKFSYANSTSSRPSFIYSFFILTVVGIVIVVMVVSFIGFFVVTNSIAKTAQYFVPKRVRIWVVGGGSGESELLGNDNNEHEEAEAEFDGHYGDAEELDHDDDPEWNVMDTSSSTASNHRT